MMCHVQSHSYDLISPLYVLCHHLTASSALLSLSILYVCMHMQPVWTCVQVCVSIEEALTILTLYSASVSSALAAAYIRTGQK